MNVAGTAALGDYLLSQIQNTRILFGESPQYPTASSLTASSAVAGPAATVGSSPGGASAGAVSSAVSQPPTHAQLAQQLAQAELLNAQALFGEAQPASPAPLPPIAGQTAHQIETVALQSSLIAQEFNNVSTLFSAAGIGTNLNTFA